MAVWYEVIAQLRDFIRAAAIVKFVEGGALNPEDFNLAAENGKTGAIFLIRDREVGESLLKNSGGQMVFFVENWVYSDDVDPLEGYRVLAAQEAAFKKLLRNWVYERAAQNSGFDILDVSLEETIGDADSRRPYLGSRMSVELQWSLI